MKDSITFQKFLTKYAVPVLNTEQAQIVESKLQLVLEDSPYPLDSLQANINNKSVIESWLTELKNKVSDTEPSPEIEKLISYVQILMIIENSISTAEPFTPKWFEESAQAENYQQLYKKAEQYREKILTGFSLQKLKEKKGKDLLVHLFYNDGTKKESLSYMLEHAADTNIFGGIGGGSAFKFNLFFHNSMQSWVSGAPRSPEILSEEQAILRAEKIRDSIVAGASIIEKQSPLETVEDYKELSKALSDIPYISSVWILKYYQMLYPEVFSVWYGKDAQERVIRFLHEKPADDMIVRSGQIELFVKQCRIPSWIFAEIYSPIEEALGLFKIKKKAHKNSLGDKTDKQNIWLIGTGYPKSFLNEFLETNMISIGWEELGDFTQYTSRKEVTSKLKELGNPQKSYSNDSKAVWEFSNEIKAGDTVYVKIGSHEIAAKGTVTGGYQYFPEQPDHQKNQIPVKWESTGTWTYEESMFPQKTLTKITDNPLSVGLENLVKNEMGNIEEVQDEEIEVTHELYTAEDFLQEAFMSSEQYEILRDLLLYKKNVVLQGAPGVGKTFLAKRLAYSIMTEIDADRVMMIQFHQSYSYEDFVIGYRPSQDGFELKTGPFYDFCKKASDDLENDYFFIIDEINRGNLSKIFGELFMLIEGDKRGIPLRLLYKDEEFAIPENLYLVGTMNTADRSLAIMDYALRRRFAFFDVRPGFESDGFRSYQKSLNSDKFDRLIDTIKQLNIEISNDDSLGEGFSIGHSYFCALDSESLTDRTLSNIVDYELIPLLKEYWFSDSQKVRIWSENLRRSIR